MKVGELGPHFGQGHFARGDPVAEGTAELFEARGLLLLRGGTLALGHLGDEIHRCQQGNAAFKALADLLSSFRKSQVPVRAYGVAALATMTVEYIPGQFLRAFAVGSHAV